MQKLLPSEDWDLTTSASSPDFSYEIAPSCDLLDTRCVAILDTHLRKHSKKLIQAKEYTLQTLRRNIQQIEVQNVRLRSENTQLRNEIQFCREAILKNRSSKVSRGIDSKSALYSISLAMILALTINLDLSSSDEPSFGTRKMLMSIQEPVNLLKYGISVAIGCVGIWLICYKKKTVDDEGRFLC